MLVLVKILTVVLFSFSLINIGHCDVEDLQENTNIELLSKETLFISLGSYCGPADFSRVTGFRKAAFPFDWIVSLDGEKLIRILEEDFLHFLDVRCLFPNSNGSALLNDCYHIEFVHEGGWKQEEFFANLEVLRSKYQRRIERFRNLNHYEGKVCFLRAAYIRSDDDENRFFKSKDNVEITPEHALKLYNAIEKRFPSLDFSLIIINPFASGYHDIIEEKTLLDNLFMIRAPIENVEAMKVTYKTYFTKLLENESSKRGL